MNTQQQKKVSKFLSLILRHKPETIDLQLDQNGWANVQELLTKVNGNHLDLSFEELLIVVENNDKRRFVFSEDKNKIRANQGHSIKIELNLTKATPREKLFHGTADKNLASIKEKGLIKGKRHHVHLSENLATARAVGQRYGKPVLLTILAANIHNTGQVFYLSENNVWLTDHVSPEFIIFNH